MDVHTPATVVQEVIVEASTAKVFAALTEPKQLVEWWGDDTSYRTTGMEQDFRVGGAWRTTGRDAQGHDFAVKGVYRIIDAPRVLEYTWLYDWSGAKDLPETIVRFELEDVDGKTRVRVTHSGFPSPEAQHGHQQGWIRVLGWLDTYVS